MTPFHIEGGLARARRSLLYRGNEKLRRLGLQPSAVGASAGRDALVHALMRRYVGAGEALGRLLGRRVISATAQYAFPRYT